MIQRNSVIRFGSKHEVEYLNAAADFIERQQAEIERLQAEIERLREGQMQIISLSSSPQ